MHPPCVIFFETSLFARPWLLKESDAFAADPEKRPVAYTSRHCARSSTAVDIGGLECSLPLNGKQDWSPKLVSRVSCFLSRSIPSSDLFVVGSSWRPSLYKARPRFWPRQAKVKSGWPRPSTREGSNDQLVKRRILVPVAGRGNVDPTWHIIRRTKFATTAAAASSQYSNDNANTV